MDRFDLFSFWVSGINKLFGSKSFWISEVLICRQDRAKVSHLLPGGRRVTPSQPTIAPPPPINMVLCATPYRVPDEEKKESEGRRNE